MIVRVVSGLVFALGAAADYLHSDGQDANGHPLPDYSPGRPPSIPLAVRSPYLSAWVTTAGNTTLNSGSATFWSGFPLGWDGMVAVDNITYEYLGTGAQSLQRISGVEPARPQTVSYDAHYSNFTFLAGPVEINASFFSPVTPKDICRTAIPISYLTTTVRVLDNQTHTIRVYSDINDAWIRRQRNSQLLWDLVQDVHAPPINVSAGGNATKPAHPTGTNQSIPASEAPYTWVLQQGVHYFMAEDDDMPQWGNFTYSTAAFGASLSYDNGDAVGIRYGFVTQQNLTSVVHRNYAGFAGRESIFAFAHDFGRIGKDKTVSVRYSIGSVQTPAARYLYYGGVAQLRPWWHTCYGEDTMALVRFHWHDFATVSRLAAEFSASLQNDIEQFYTSEENNSARFQKPVPAAPFPNVTSTSTTTLTTTASLSNVMSAPTSTNPAHGTYVFDPDTAYGFISAHDNTTGVAAPGVSEADALYAIVALSARQVMGGYIYVIPPTPQADSCAKGPIAPPTEPLMFQKEVSSDGNLNTIDVMYPAAPFFLWANPEMLRYLLQPAYEMQEGTFYPNSYCAHDIGAQFPNATGHVDGNDEYMPVEESGDFILLSYAYYRFSGNTAWLTSHYRLLKQFAQYLIDFSLVPAAQLSTDDFAGTLANQTNLAIKGILGIQAMSEVARIAGESADAAQFAQIARDYYRLWTYLALDPTGHKHALLAYQWRSSWGLLYNVFMDKLLHLNVVDEDVYAMQSAWYAQVSQVFGVPLDSRHHYTKSDWMMWTAATCTAETRSLLVTSLAYWLNYTTTEQPFSDLFEVIGTGYYPQVPQDIRFKARPVVGGHFAILALARSNQLGGNATIGAKPTGASSRLSPPTTVVVTGGTDTAATPMLSTTLITTTTSKAGVVSTTPPTGPPTGSPTGSPMGSTSTG